MRHVSVVCMRCVCALFVRVSVYCVFMYYCVYVRDLCCASPQLHAFIAVANVLAHFAFVGQNLSGKIAASEPADDTKKTKKA